MKTFSLALTYIDNKCLHFAAPLSLMTLCLSPFEPEDAIVFLLSGSKNA